MENNSLNILTDDQLDAIVTAATESNDGKMINIKSSTEIELEAELESAIVTNILTGDTAITEGYVQKVIDNSGEIPEHSLIPKVESNSDNPMSEEEMLTFIELISKYKNDRTYPVYKNMPESMKQTVREIAFKNRIPSTEWNHIAAMILEEFISDSKIDQAFVDLEKEIDKALEMPSVVDMYSEHTKNVMETYIPEMAEKIKDEFPDKSARLLAIRDAFTRSYTFSFAKESYDTNARVRKMIRRWDREKDKVLDGFNYLNSKSNFKMNDVTQIPQILSDILINEPRQIIDMHKKSNEEVPERYQKIFDMRISTEDITKFCILICESCKNLNPDDILDAAYMYYMIKNIIVLKHTKEAKTEFAIELINNICDIISFIRNKEDEFNESMDKSKSGKKHRSDK